MSRDAFPRLEREQNEREDDYERATYCGCDKGQLTQKEREEGKCKCCGKRL